MLLIFVTSNDSVLTLVFAVSVLTLSVLKDEIILNGI